MTSSMKSAETMNKSQQKSAVPGESPRFGMSTDRGVRGWVRSENKISQSEITVPIKYHRHVLCESGDGQLPTCHRFRSHKSNRETATIRSETPGIIGPPHIASYMEFNLSCLKACLNTISSRQKITKVVIIGISQHMIKSAISCRL